MKRIALSVILVCLSSLISYADTTVSSNIIRDTVWSKADSPYLVTQPIDIYPNVSLTIDPGVIVKFSKGAGIDVFGTLKALGAENDMIIFTSASAPSQDWTGIYFKPGAIGTNTDADGNYVSGSIVKYCDISYGSGNSIVNGYHSGERSVLIISFDSPTNFYIINSKIHDNFSTGVATNAIGTLYIGFNSITDNYGHGILCTSNNATIKIINNIISNNKFHNGIYNNSNNTTISGNFISDNGDCLGDDNDNINIYNTGNNVTISYNTITGFGCSSVKSAIYSTGKFSTIVKNIISKNPIECNDCSIVNNVIKDTQGIYGPIIEYNLFIRSGYRDSSFLPNNVFSNNVLIGNNFVGLGDYTEVVNGNIMFNNSDLCIQGTTTKNNLIMNNSIKGGWSNLFKESLENNIIKNNSISMSSGQDMAYNIISNNEITDNVFNQYYFQASKTFNGNNVYNNKPYDIHNYRTLDLTASNNYWGTTDVNAIDNHIYDYWDDITLGKVIYNPIATKPFRIVIGDKCDSTLFVDFTFFIPVLTVDNINYYWILLEFDDSRGMFKLTNIGEGAKANNYNNCQPATFSFDGINYKLHVPSVAFNESFYWVDLEYVPTVDGQMWFQFTNVGAN